MSCYNALADANLDAIIDKLYVLQDISWLVVEKCIVQLMGCGQNQTSTAKHCSVVLYHLSQGHQS